MGDFIYNTTMYYAFNIGWDQTNATFDTNYVSEGFIPFVTELSKMAKQPFNIELADQANLYS